MEVTPTRPPTRLDLCDAALLVAFAVLAAVGIRQTSLLFADGAVSLAAAWLFNFWDLLLAQVPTRAVGLMALYGPVWVLRWALSPAAETYVVAAHILYFGVPLVLWLVIRAVQSHPAFARLYLCLALMLVFYPSELIVGLGIWLVWAAIVAKSRLLAARSGAGDDRLRGAARLHPSGDRLDQPALPAHGRRACRDPQAVSAPGSDRRCRHDRFSALRLPRHRCSAAAHQSDRHNGLGDVALRLHRSCRDGGDADRISAAGGPLASDAACQALVLPARAYAYGRSSCCASAPSVCGLPPTAPIS